MLNNKHTVKWVERELKKKGLVVTSVDGDFPLQNFQCVCLCSDLTWRDLPNYEPESAMEEWHYAMRIFRSAPGINDRRKILTCIVDHNFHTNETLVDFYKRKFPEKIPDGVEFVPLEIGSEIPSAEELIKSSLSDEQG